MHRDLEQLLHQLHRRILDLHVIGINDHDGCFGMYRGNFFSGCSSGSASIVGGDIFPVAR